jgi:CheY-like chemotaxis protein
MLSRNRSSGAGDAVMVGRVVVVEDDPGLAHAIGQIAERAGYRVSIFTSSTQAWDDLKATRRPRLLITETNFPAHQPNGVALAAHARAYHRHLPVIFVTGNTEAARWTASAVDDATALLLKPVTQGLLMARIHQLAPLAA